MKRNKIRVLKLADDDLTKSSLPVEEMLMPAKKIEPAILQANEEPALNEEPEICNEDLPAVSKATHSVPAKSTGEQMKIYAIKKIFIGLALALAVVLLAETGIKGSEDRYFFYCNAAIFVIFLLLLKIFKRMFAQKSQISDTIAILITSILLFFATVQMMFFSDGLLKQFVYQDIFSIKYSAIILTYLITINFSIKLIIKYCINLYMFFFDPLFKKKEVKKTYVPEKPDFENELMLCIGEVHNPENGDREDTASLLTIKEKSLYTNLYVFGSIGSGKTVFLLSAIEQLLCYKKQDKNNKPCGLFIDEKGNLGTNVLKTATRIGRQDDVYIFDLSGNIIWNVIHDPKVDAGVIARRLKTIMECTVEKGADWIRAYAYDFLNNAIKLCRITSEHYYVTLKDIHAFIHKEALITQKLNYLKENKDKIIKTISELETDLANIDLDKYIDRQEDLLKTYFVESWFMLKNKDPEVFGYISTAVSQLIEPFIDPKVSHIFNPDNPETINFKGFDWMINEGKLFVYSVPDSIYEGLGKYISLFMKIPFQKTCLSRIPKTTPGTEVYDPNYNSTRPILFVADENQNSYHQSDNEALDKLREAKVIHICLTQSFVSLLAKHPSEHKIRQYIGSFRNKYFLAADDDRSAKYYSELCGQELKEYKSFGFSESSRNADIDYLHNNINTDDSNLNSSVNIQERNENRFNHTKFLDLQLFQGIFTGFDGVKKILPQYTYTKPYFINWDKDYFSFIEDMS
jgi:hypothetical protein